jgi:hypothetical protein
MDALRRVAVLGMLGVLSACAAGPFAGTTNASATGAPPSVDKQAGASVFFPPPTSTEMRKPRFELNVDPDPARRQFFADQMNLATSTPSRPLPIIVQAVGPDQRTLVFTMLEANSEPTPYLARAFLARITSLVRVAPALAEMGISQDFDVYDMAGVLGFTSIVVTDAKKFAHEVRLTKN